MGCNCGGSGGSYSSSSAATAGQMPHTSKNRLPVKVQIHDFSEEPIALIGSHTGVSYGYQKDGNVILMWKSDVDAAPQYFTVLLPT